MARMFSVAAPGLPESTRVLAIRALERLSAPYEIDVSLVLPAEEASDFAVELDVDATVSLHDAEGTPVSVFAGIVADTELIHVLGHEALFRVVLRPRLWRLSLGEHSRVWVDKSFQEILEAVLTENGVTEYELSLSKKYPKLLHTCQYHESDLDFLSRWMEREGIYYFFEHTDAGEKLKITDDGAIHELQPTSPVRYYATGTGDTSTVAAMYEFRSLHGSVAEKVQLSDYQYMQPSQEVSGETPVWDRGTGVVSVFGGNLGTPAEAKRLARVGAEERGAKQTIYKGRGRVFGLRSGYKFELDEHSFGALNQEYLVTELEHRGADMPDAARFARWIDPNGRFLGKASVPVYDGAVTAIRSSVPYRAPRRSPVPRIWGLEHALIDGPADTEYGQIDDRGRYKLTILFDESGLKDGKASAWVRMMQPHGGSPEGFHFPLRKGTEVVLAFVEGDPDRPLIVGTAANPQVPSPVTEANATQNVIMTGGENRIEIEDDAGKQYIQMYSPPQNSSLHLGAHNGPYHNGHNFSLSTDGNGRIHTGGDRDITVGANQTEDVVGDLTESYHSTQTITVDGTFTETIQGAATQTINGGETRTVNSGQTETITGGETRTINPTQTETVSASVTRTIGADLTDTIGAGVTHTVAAAQTDTIVGSLTQSVTGGINVTTPAALTLIAVGGAKFDAPAGFRVIAGTGVRYIDFEWKTEGAEIKTSYGEDISKSIIKMEFVLGMALGVFVSKAETVGTKIEFIGAGTALEGMKVSDAAARIRAGGPKLWMKALITMK